MGLKESIFREMIELSEKFEIKLDKKEVKNALNDVVQSDYYNRIAAQVKKVRTGQINDAFKGNAEKWIDLFHLDELDKYDSLILSSLRSEYQEYQQYITLIKNFISFHKLNLKKTLIKEAGKKINKKKAI
jgi:CRISPR/Cas system CMR subunit Cmr6 (Cas7 group RAMP superfamily)